jgi:hypothetical protein
VLVAPNPNVKLFNIFKNFNLSLCPVGINLLFN